MRGNRGVLIVPHDVNFYIVVIYWLLHITSSSLLVIYANSSALSWDLIHVRSKNIYITVGSECSKLARFDDV